MSKIALFALSVTVFGAQEGSQWIRQFGTPQYDDAVSIAASSTGVYVLYTSTEFGVTSALPVHTLRKLAFDGSTVWAIQIVLPSALWLRGLSADETGVYVAGRISAASVDVLVRKYDPNGNLLWSRQFGTPHWDEATAIASGPAGVYVVGNTNWVFEGQSSPGSGSLDAFVARLDPATGGTIWLRQFGTSVTDGAGAVAVVSDTVYVNGLIANTSRFLAAYDTSGSLLRMRDLGADGVMGIVAQGSNLYGLADIGRAVVKIDPMGNTQWRRSTPSNESFFALAADETGIYGAGVLFSQGNRDGILVKYDSHGNVLWRQPLQTPAPESFAGAAAGFGRIWTLGITEGSLQAANAGSHDIFVQSYDAGTGLYFVPINNCRILNTQAYGSGALLAGETRTVSIRGVPPCGVPADAQAYALELGAIPAGPLAFLSLWPSGSSRPLVSTLNSFHGGPVWNSVLTGAGEDGTISVYATDRTDLTIDVTGYFTNNPQQSYAFYSVDPCRLLDTRRTLGSPSLLPGARQETSIATCGLPSSTGALAVNATAVPAQALSSLTVWMAGTVQPSFPQIAAPDGSVTARSLILRGGSAPSVNTLSSNNADLVLDLSGYFGQPGPGGKRFYPTPGCRVADTRLALAALRGGETRNLAIAGRCGIPSTATAFAMNLTAIPTGPLSFLTVWPAGRPQPLTSSLNSYLGRITANSVLSAAGAGGAVSVYATDATNVVLDVTGYFE